MSAAVASSRTSCRESEQPDELRDTAPYPPIWYRAEPASAAERPEALLTVPEACAALRISKWTLYKLIQRRQMVTIKIGASRYIPVRSIQDLIDRLRAEAD